MRTVKDPAGRPHRLEQHGSMRGENDGEGDRAAIGFSMTLLQVHSEREKDFVILEGDWNDLEDAARWERINAVRKLG